MPTPDSPLAGSCACGTVRFQVTADFLTSGYCHCRRCQHRTGTAWSMMALAPSDGFEVTGGAEALSVWTVPSGLPKVFCSHCGGHVYAGDPAAGKGVAVRLGALDGEPGIRPLWHQYVEFAAPWEALPDDGLPRYPGPRPTA
jgi:hypothetical protein